MKILFLTHPYPNYGPDLLLHGLRKLLGPTVVDFPRKDCVYEGVLGLGVCPDNQRCPDWFASDIGVIDRDDIAAKVAADYFELVICDVRAAGFLQQHFPVMPRRLALIDGEDRPARITPGPFIIFRRETDGTDFSIPLPMALPGEILHWIGTLDQTPKTHSVGFLGSSADDGRREVIEAITRDLPDALVATTRLPTEGDPLPDGRMGRDDYYRALQSCRVLLSLPGAGYDTFRFWENSACNAVHLSASSPLLIPNDFANGIHILRFGDVEGLRRMLDKALSNPQQSQEMTECGRGHLARHHLTEHRAAYLIDRARTALG
jgi:hypothetical protein